VVGADVRSDEIKVGQFFDVAKTVLSPVLKFGWKVQVDGLDNLPAEGSPAILCPNHTSFIDSVFLPLVLPRRITYVGKAEYMDDWKTKYLFPAMGMIPIDRGGGKAAVRALNTAARVLERGELFGIFPEGTRSRDGALHKGHTGPARLALRTGAPLVPVGLRGTRAIQPPEAKFPKPFMACSIGIGTPISVDRYLDRADDHITLRQLTDEVMFEIRNLSGQEYVDTYATKKAESLPTDVARVPAANGHETSEAPRRSSADVLNPQGAVPVAH
jgi:1-acyl-sn-glycerol-3-phosphate acyltransferase